jgi:riboflavin synthase
VAESHRLEVEIPTALAPLVAVKGSVAVDGVSLTVNETEGERFAVNIIPHSWAETNLPARQVGDDVNIEVDMLARYVARQLAFRAEP